MNSTIVYESIYGEKMLEEISGLSLSQTLCSVVIISSCCVWTNPVPPCLMASCSLNQLFQLFIEADALFTLSDVFNPKTMNSWLHHIISWTYSLSAHSPITQRGILCYLWKLWYHHWWWVRSNQMSHVCVSKIPLGFHVKIYLACSWKQHLHIKEMSVKVPAV